MEKEFISLASSYSKRVVTPLSYNKAGVVIGGGNKYRFFRGKPYLVKDKEDIKFFEDSESFKSFDPKADSKEAEKAAKAKEAADKEAAKKEAAKGA